MSEILNVKNLRTYFNSPEGLVRSVDGVSFTMERGKTLAIIGESGSGKTVTSLSLTHLLPENATVAADQITLNGRDIHELTRAECRKLRGKEISMIFQEPMTALNPVYKISRQLGEVFKLHEPNLSRKEIHERSIRVLEQVGVPNPEERLDVYPYQLSGGLRQRVMIAIALASSPDLLIADEPTTALDVTIQAQIISLLKELQADTQMSILLITHDFGVVSQMADTVAVMYAGKVVEYGPMETLFNTPGHPYTRGLINSIPGFKVKRGGRLESIVGTVPSPLALPEGCRFHTRCPYATEQCRTQAPPEEYDGDHMVACWNKADLP